MNIKKLLHKFYDFMDKDVKIEGETKSFYVMMRWYYFITAVYIFIFTVITIVTGLWKDMPIVFIWLPLHIASFFTTYKFKKRVIFHIFSFGILSWFILAEIFMGWNYGAHYFLYPLLVISFFAMEGNRIGKFLYTFFVGLLHIGAFFYSHFSEPIIELSVTLEYVIHILHILTLFASVYLVCTIFSNEEQKTVRELGVYAERLKREAETDALTGLLNRRSMYKFLDRATERAKEQGRYSVIMGDIDYFKKINDTKGHECGDIVLKSIAEYFAKYMGDKGEVSRWGGEEFLFIVNGGKEEAYKYVEEMRKHIEEMKIIYNNEIIKVTMTFGVGEYTKGYAVNQLIKKVDDRLYVGKQTGRNRTIMED